MKIDSVNTVQYNNSFKNNTDTKVKYNDISKTPQDSFVKSIPNQTTKASFGSLYVWQKLNSNQISDAVKKASDYLKDTKYVDMLIKDGKLFIQRKSDYKIISIKTGEIMIKDLYGKEVTISDKSPKMFERSMKVPDKIFEEIKNAFGFSDGDLVSIYCFQTSLEPKNIERFAVFTKLFDMHYHLRHIEAFFNDISTLEKTLEETQKKLQKAKGDFSEFLNNDNSGYLSEKRIYSLRNMFNIDKTQV